MLRHKFYIAFLLSLLSLYAHATHNRAGEITYRWLFGYTYEVKIITYTNTNIIGGQQPADRCEDTLYFGDGSRAVVPRSNGTTFSLCGSGIPDGEIIASGIKKNIHITTHTYPGPGTYRIYMFDPNRNAGIINIPNSVNQPFYIESSLTISTFLGQNSSPILTIPPIDNGCVFKCFVHNPGAYDPDGDSLSYELTTCRTFGGQTVPGYSYPSTGGGFVSVDAHNGNLTWCTPQMQGEYNLAMIIREWRKNADGDWVSIGYVLRDLQVDIGSCQNEPPAIRQPHDTCVVAGTLLSMTIYAADTMQANQPDVVTLTANGGPFVGPSPIASFASVPSLGTVQGAFSWQTQCVHIRKAPYQVTVKAEDNDPDVHLVDFKTFNITVVAPPPLNLVGTPLGTYVSLKWNKPGCHLTTGNKIARYLIYRKSDCNTWVHAPCEVGVPAYTGFVYIGQTASMNDTTFIDTNGGNGLTQGVNYSYIVVAEYDDGALSYASNQTCVQLKRDVPILVNVDVQTTDPATGSIFVRWIKPLLSAGNLDTTSVTGPYEFRLMHYDGFAGSTYTQVYSVTKPYFAGFNQLSDTTFIHSGINTLSFAHTYKIEFYANGQFVGNGQKASSVFLSLTPGDNNMQLSWQHQVPWGNYKYYIYRKAPSQSSFTLHDSTAQMTYLDTGLVNGASYCYKVQSKGQYSDPTIYRPLLNFSEEVCAKPVDLIPPCSPTLAITSDCKVPTATLRWNNPNHVCCDDAVKYNIYYTDIQDTPLQLIDSVKIMHDTILVFDNLTSIAGCYAITAVDSFGNESAQSEIMCIDNCPEYELPNVITVNGDGVNDFFKAIKNRFVKDIDLKVYNRWGQLVYETTDPAFNWDGKVIQTRQLCSEGTYFYVCQVNEIRVKGITPRYLRGFVQVFHK
ncbi:MAG: gliding motility-associated C-terminal domain-containing protein [Bacteroidetes bacterium]|nr:gliding motility-associated C-terminal domain-containing protein [Bacteroidota bacterium]